MPLMLRRIGRTLAAICGGLVLATLLTELFFQLIDATPLRWVLVEPQVSLMDRISPLDTVTASMSPACG